MTLREFRRRGDRVDLDGQEARPTDLAEIQLPNVDAVTIIGEARWNPEAGRWQALANVCGMLCVIEVRLHARDFLEEFKRAATEALDVAFPEPEG